MIDRSKWIGAASLLPLLALATGCSDRLTTYSVEGQVNFKTGEPVHVGTVELKSRDHDGVQARGSIKNDGSFELTTYEDGDGAVAGQHDAVVVQFIMTEDVSGHRPSTIGVVDRRYASYATSDLVVEINPAGPNKIVIEVEGIRKDQPEDHEH